MIANGKWSGRHLGWCGLALSILLSSPACAPEGGSRVTETADDPMLLTALAGGCAQNSVAGNGLSSNGLSGNGLCGNGLGAKGLTAANMSTTSFASWFNSNPDLANVVMRYVYKCAAPFGTLLTWTNPSTSIPYTWIGGLGLAPGWTGGAAATVAEQQVVTACLGALVNKYGVSVLVAVEGRTAAGTQIPVLPSELTTFSVNEACFFGNLFTGEGVYAGIDHSIWAAPKSSVRACAFDTSKSGALSPECPPMVYVGSCSTFCKLDKSKTFYESCTYNGVSYKPLTTRMMPSDVYTCGDGVCQFTEKCGTRSEWYQCKDCGPCP